ncbi:olfactory receptor 1A1-like, partial [Sinocyclocheilus grahami]|uniref:olfactory receptor 1A1-like n=1 Tax=Sinocyclocheilus grahami TaxID=75366 RepID=UPI0007AD4CCA
LSLIRPVHFYITDFSGVSHIRYYYIFLFFVYIITVLGNYFLMIVIIVDRNLHTPKYIAVFNLALTDICESTAVIPQQLEAYMFGNQFILYGLCMSQMFFNCVIFAVQSITLTILSFDRFVAICLPLRYHMIVTHRSMLVMIGASWIIGLSIATAAIIFLTRLSFCRVVVIVNSFYCDHGPISRSSCSDYFQSFVISVLYPCGEAFSWMA